MGGLGGMGGVEVANGTRGKMSLGRREQQAGQTSRGHGHGGSEKANLKNSPSLSLELASMDACKCRQIVDLSIE